MVSTQIFVKWMNEKIEFNAQVSLLGLLISNSESLKPSYSVIKKTNKKKWTSLVAQWWRIHLPMQETWVWSLIWEDPTCRRATKPLHCSYWVCAQGQELKLLSPCVLEPMLHNREVLPQWKARAPPLESSPCTPQLEKAHAAMKAQHSQNQNNLP